jgi:hypothetical protein
MKSFRFPLFCAAAALVLSARLSAWDAPGHRIVNQLAVKTLPPDFPDFVREPAAIDRLVFLAEVPDRWSHSVDVSLKHSDWPNHYLDVEQLPLVGMDPAKISSFRYEFVADFAKAREAHASEFKERNPETDAFRSYRWPGFLPWTVMENFYKLKTAFSCLKVYRALGTPEEIKNAEADVIYMMGTFGHYVGDLSQPLHTTIHHDGWAGDNPHGYFVGKYFHSWIDSGLILKAHITLADVISRAHDAEPLSMAARPDERDPIFVSAMDFLLEQNKLVEPIYQLDLEHKLGRGDFPVSPEAKELIMSQLAKGGNLLGALWLTAWRSSQPDPYLRSVLIKRKLAANPAPATAPEPPATPQP